MIKTNAAARRPGVPSSSAIPVAGKAVDVGREVDATVEVGLAVVATAEVDLTLVAAAEVDLTLVAAAEVELALVAAAGSAGLRHTVACGRGGVSTSCRSRSGERSCCLSLGTRGCSHKNVLSGLGKQGILGDNGNIHRW
jgi:hypothetical protein